MSDPKKERCSVQVTAPGNSFHYYRCTHPAKVERNGKWYCGQHNPEKVAARREKASQDYRRKLEEEDVRREGAAIRMLRLKGYTVTPPGAPHE